MLDPMLARPPMRPLCLVIASLALVAATACSAPASRPMAAPLPRYLALIAQHPHVVEAPGDAARGEIGIVTDANHIARIENEAYGRYLASMPPAAAYAASRAGVLVEDPWTLIVREAVIFPNGSSGLYRRHLTPIALDGGAPGAYCLPILADGRVVLVREYRHQERAWRIGPPGGFREPGETDAEAAAREAFEETGMALGPLTPLGVLDVDGEGVPLFLGHVQANAEQPHPDMGEALAGTVALSPNQLHAALLSGHYTDASGRTYGLHGVLAHAYLLWLQWQKS